MSDKLPEPTKLSTFIINRNKQKFCDCYNWINRMKGIYPRFEIDTTNRVVTCRHCGVFIDPFEALVILAERDERREREVKKLCDAAKEAANYKPWKRAIKRIEQSIGKSGDMIPHCPKCGQPFRLEQITGYSHEKIIPNKGWAKESEAEK